MPKGIFQRCLNNPILTGAQIPYRANTVFNAGVTMIDDETLLLLRVEDRRGMSHLTVARSSDGVTEWRVDPEPTLLPRPDTHPEEFWGIEDPRITCIEEGKRWIIVYCAYSKAGPMVSLASTHDFRTFERIGAALPPENKDAALFPTKFDGRWALLHRPVPGFPGAGAHVWISFSPDLKHWGDHKLLLEARSGGWWDAGKVGLSPPPLRTDEGWLIMYHGVRNTAGGSIYRLGLALLDLEDPRRVIRRGDEWVFSPQEPYERTGDVGNVAFPCGWVIRNDEVWIYYGAADTSIALATAKLPDLLSWLKSQGDA